MAMNNERHRLFFLEFPIVTEMVRGLDEYLTDYPFSYSIKVNDEEELYDVVSWSMDNLRNKPWTIDKTITYNHYLVCSFKIDFYFKFKEDAMAFKLRWL